MPHPISGSFAELKRAPSSVQKVCLLNAQPVYMIVSYMPECGLGGGFQLASQAAFSGSPRASQGCQAEALKLVMPKATVPAGSVARSMPSGGATDPILLSPSVSI